MAYDRLRYVFVIYRWVTDDPLRGQVQVLASVKCAWGSALFVFSLSMVTNIFPST